MNDARMPRPDRAYNILVGIPVTGLTVLFAGINWAVNERHMRKLTRAARRLTNPPKPRRTVSAWLASVWERFDAAVCEGNNRLSGSDDD